MLRFGDLPDTTAPTEVFVVQARNATARGHDRTAAARAVLDAVVAVAPSRVESCPAARAQEALAALESSHPDHDDWSEHVEWAAARVREALATAGR